MPAGPGAAGMPASHFGVCRQLVHGGQSLAVCRLDAQAAPRHPRLDPWTSRDQGRAIVWGCCRDQAPWAFPPQRSLTNAPDPRAPKALTWQLPAITPAAAARALRHLRLRMPPSTLFWMPWAPTCQEPDRQTPRIRKVWDCLLRADCACPHPTYRGAACLTERLHSPGSHAAEEQPMRSRASHWVGLL